MTKQEFLKLLKSALEDHRVLNIQDILADYEEHFTHGLSKGKQEEEIAKNLGSPTTIAKAYQTESMINEIKDPKKHFSLSLALKVIGRLLVIAPFNFFALIIPGSLIFGLLTAGWSMTVAVGAVSMAILTTIPTLAALSLNFWAWTTAISASLGLFGLAILGGMMMFFVSKYILLALISYLQWNLKFVLEK